MREEGRVMTRQELRRIRGVLGLTQEQLAEHLGVARNTVARWESGRLPIREPMAKLIRVVASESGADVATPKRKK